MGEAYSALGYDAEAEQASRRAVDLSQNLPLAQRYFIEASLARVTKDNQKAIAAYENLAKSFPDNLDVQFALGSLYEDAGDLDKALGPITQKSWKADGKNLDACWPWDGSRSKREIRRRASIRSIGRRHIAIDLDNPGAAGADSAGDRDCLQADEQAGRGLAQL